VLKQEFKVPKEKSALEDLQQSKVQLKEGRLFVYELLHQWRNRYACIWDGKPNEFASITSLVVLANQDPLPSCEQEITTIIKSTGQSMGLITGQEQTILRILKEGESFTSRVNQTECHNCLKTGHIAKQCPFAPNPDRVKEFYAKNKAERRQRQKVPEMVGKKTEVEGRIDKPAYLHFHGFRNQFNLVL